MREVWPFLKSAGKIWWALVGSAFLVIAGWATKSLGHPDYWIAELSLPSAVLLLFVAAYLAWRKEYLANIGGPEILVRWSVDMIQRDVLDFRNEGTALALQIAVGPLLHPELGWSRPIYIPQLDARANRTVEADFFRFVGGGNVELGRMLHVLHTLPESAKVSFRLSYQNLQGTRFERLFTLRIAQIGRKEEIECRPGKLEIKR